MCWNTSIANSVFHLLNTQLLGAVQFELLTLLLNKKMSQLVVYIRGNEIDFLCVKNCYKFPLCTEQ
jgi:hypothetical protein